MSGNKPRYPMVRSKGRRGGGPTPYLENPEFRQMILDNAAPGLSRRGVAALSKVPLRTLTTWIDRGMAEPDVEPWGSFALEYLARERGLEMACQEVAAHWANSKLIQAKREQSDPEWDGNTKSVSRGDVAIILDILRSRYPIDHGIGTHRQPEGDPDPHGYMERRQLTLEQLTALFKNPNEEMLPAIKAAKAELLAILTSEGTEE